MEKQRVDEDLLVILVLLVLAALAVPVLAIMALVSISGLKRRVGELEREVAKLYANASDAAAGPGADREPAARAPTLAELTRPAPAQTAANPP
ncbi:MAG TPA: hypothetical protein VK325_11465, partial [Pseudoxanthomonas sp.]|nr:hypothetical protein [Pseudoxanthomonas sp.]